MTSVEPSQCKVVSWGLGKVEEDDCPNQGGWAWDITRALQKGGVNAGVSTYDTAFNPLEDSDEVFSMIKQEIDANRPVLFSVKWPGLIPPWGFHELVVAGYTCAYNSKTIHYYMIRGCEGDPVSIESKDLLNFFSNDEFTVIDMIYVTN